MSFADRLFTLRATPPFDRLHTSELMVVSEVARERGYAAGAQVASPGRPLGHLVVTTDGGFVLEGHGPLPPIFELVSLLYDREPTAAIVADARGGRALLLSKRHVLTLVKECPALLVGFVETGGRSVSLDV